MLLQQLHVQISCIDEHTHLIITEYSSSVILYLKQCQQIRKYLLLHMHSGLFQCICQYDPYVNTLL